MHWSDPQGERSDHLLAANENDKVIRRMLALLGRLGTTVDGEMVRPFLDNPDREVADIAWESLLRLTDPLLVPDRW